MRKRKQVISVFVEKSGERTYDVSVKAANMYMNRFCIDEEAASELTGIHCLNKLLQPISHEKHEEKFFKKTKSSFEKLAENHTDDYEPHFVFASQALYYNSVYNWVNSSFRELMKKYQYESFIVTSLYMIQKNLIDHEKMKSYCRGEDHRLQLSVNDDLEILFENVKTEKMGYGNFVRSGYDDWDMATWVRAKTYYLPRITEEDMALVEQKDHNYLQMFEDYYNLTRFITKTWKRLSMLIRYYVNSHIYVNSLFDEIPHVKRNGRKRLDSDSTYILAECKRRTFRVDLTSKESPF